jgi:hypothetical protein
MSMTPNSKNLGATSTGVRPEDLLPNLHITVEGKAARHCTSQGAEVRTYTGSFLVDLKEAENAKIELPSHRFFFHADKITSMLSKNKTLYDVVWSQVTGSIVLPVITRQEQLLSRNGFLPTGGNPVNKGTIVEVSHSWVGRNAKYRKTGDIRMKEGNYLYIAELCLYQGSEVLTIFHNEKSRKLLYKSNDLPPRYSSLEQEYYRTEAKATPEMLNHKGVKVLEEAAIITKNRSRRYENNKR